MSGVAAVATAWGLDEESDRLPRAARTERLLRRAAAATSDAERAELHDRVIAANMPVAAQLAARYSGRGVASEDLEQVAYLALVKSVQGYEYAPGRDFLSYAVPTVRGELRKHFRDLGWTIRPPRRIQEAQRRITRCEGLLQQRLGRAPRPREIADHLDLDFDTVVEALAANGLFTPMSLDVPFTDGSSLRDELGENDDGYRAAEARAMLEPLIPLLSDREREMLEMRFFRNATQAEIGKAVGLTQMQVSRLLSALMARLREQLM